MFIKNIDRFRGGIMKENIYCKISETKLFILSGRDLCFLKIFKLRNILILISFFILFPLYGNTANNEGKDLQTTKSSDRSDHKQASEWKINFNKRVNDLDGILSNEEINDLTGILAEIENKTTAQVALLIIPSLNGQNLEKYSLRIASNWGLGQKDKNNGVLLLIAIRDKKLRIEVGLGLEYLLTNKICGDIINRDITPWFKEGNFYMGIRKGSLRIFELLKKDHK